MSKISPSDSFLAIGQSVRKNVKTGEEELELALFDLGSESEKDAVVTITASDFVINRRDAQTHELQQAGIKMRVADSRDL